MTGLVVWRYLFSKANRHRGRVVRIMISLALSTLIMLTILSVMDSMQSARTDALKRVRSFPVTVTVSSRDEAESLISEYGQQATGFVYREDLGLMSAAGREQGVMIRYIDSDYNGGIYASGASPEGGVYLPYRYYGGYTGTVSISTLEEGSAVRLRPVSRDYAVEGWYQSPLSDFDRTYVFLPLSSAPDNLEWTAAFTDVEDEKALASSLEKAGHDAVLWSEKDGTVYSALLLEKAVMAILLSSLHVIVLVQLVQSAQMLERTKRRECAALCLMGWSGRRLCLTFGLTGLVMSLLSTAAGTVLSALLLGILPRIMPVFSRMSFAVDRTWAASVILVVSALSWLIYALVFTRSAGEDSVMEVLGAQ